MKEAILHRRSSIVSAVALFLIFGVICNLDLGLQGTEITYTYDRLGRLTRAEYDVGVTILYTYDANGNPINRFFRGIGDLNRDGRIQIDDLVIMQCYQVGHLSPGQEPFVSPLRAADLNGDGECNSADSVLFANFLSENR